MSRRPQLYDANRRNAMRRRRHDCGPSADKRQRVDGRTSQERAASRSAIDADILTHCNRPTRLTTAVVRSEHQLGDLATRLSSPAADTIIFVSNQNSSTRFVRLIGQLNLNGRPNSRCQPLASMLIDSCLRLRQNAIVELVRFEQGTLGAALLRAESRAALRLLHQSDRRAYTWQFICIVRRQS